MLRCRLLQSSSVRVLHRTVVYSVVESSPASNLCVSSFLFYNTTITFFYPCFTNVCFSTACAGSAPFSSITLSITSQPQFGVTSVSQVPNPESGHLLLLRHSLHFLCQLFQCLALIFHLHLLFFHHLYFLLSVHFLNVIPLFQSPVAIFLYLV